eukprot:7784299-Pyramimonas_sp.AAC.1
MDEDLKSTFPMLAVQAVARRTGESGSISTRDKEIGPKQFRQDDRMTYLEATHIVLGLKQLKPPQRSLAHQTKTNKAFLLNCLEPLAHVRADKTPTHQQLPKLQLARLVRQTA